MKIGIITILKVNNYGAELQAYATQAVLKKLGYDAEIIDYLFYKHPKHKKTKASAPLFTFPFVCKLKEWLYPKISALKSLPNHAAFDCREKRFDDFHKENTSLSPTYYSIDELYSAHLDYDVYVTGSDQVWNPGIYSSIAPYFLTFAPKGKKRIAYASSFGVEQIPVYAINYYKEWLRAYDAIGVREKNALKLVEDIANVKATLVLDPTLLLTKNDWDKVSKPVIPEIRGNYILLYELTPCPYILELAYYLSKNKGLRIVRICKDAHKQDKGHNIINIIDAGPAEFLSLFSGASLIITNSFHGTAFSINFQKDFYTVLPLRKKNNSRQRSLLELFGLTERLIMESSPLPDALKMNIDYTYANQRLNEERNKSIHYLQHAIDGK